MKSDSSEASIITLHCTPEIFVPVDDARVRWFEPEKDFALMRDGWLTVGAGMTAARLRDLGHDGYRYCGIVEGSAIIALAAVWMYSSPSWELAAVWTRDDHRSHGYATAVCSFATAHIVGSGRTATCSVSAGNMPMLRVATRLGFVGRAN